jgi:hypothetical protein
MRVASRNAAKPRAGTTVLDRWGEHVEELLSKASKNQKAATPSGTRGRLAVAS